MTEDKAPPDRRRSSVGQMFIDESPQMRALGLEIVELDDGVAELRMPWNPQLVGDPSTGVIAGGAVSTLLDSCCGAAVMSRLGEKGRTATLDLRIDYMRPAMPGQAISARAEVYQVTRSVAFVRAVATDDDRDRPVASGTGAFTVEML